MTTNAIRLTPDGSKGLEIWEPVPTEGTAMEPPIQRGEVFFSDEGAGLSLGVWESTPFVGVMGPHPVYEFMLLLEGEVTILLKTGETVTVSAGQAFFLPKGLEFQWRQQGLVKKYFMIFDDAGAVTPGTAASLIVDTEAPLDPVAPRPTDPLIGPPPVLHARTSYATQPGRWRVGLWQAGQYHLSRVPFPRYELMHVLEGSMTLIDTDGQSQSFGAGETFFVPKDALYEYVIEEHIRKIYCVLDPFAA